MSSMNPILDVVLTIAAVVISIVIPLFLFWMTMIYKRLDSIEQTISKFLEFYGQVTATLHGLDHRISTMESQQQQRNVTQNLDIY